MTKHLRTDLRASRSIRYFGLEADIRCIFSLISISPVQIARSAIADKAAVALFAINVCFSNWRIGSRSFPFSLVYETVSLGLASLRSLVGRSKCATACMWRKNKGAAGLFQI